MSQIKVLMANQPRLMRELLTVTMSDQTDIEVVGEVETASDVEEAIERTSPNFLIVALDEKDRLPTFCQSILQKHPQIKIIAIAPDRNTSVFYWTSLQVRSNQIESSEAGVLGALRGTSDQFT